MPKTAIAMLGVLGTVILALAGYLVEIRGDQIQKLDARLDSLEQRFLLESISVHDRLIRMEGPNK